MEREERHLLLKDFLNFKIDYNEFIDQIQKHLFEQKLANMG